jgi:hypothetical protein
MTTIDGISRLGRVPRKLLTDQSSTPTQQLKRDGSRRGFNEEYLGVCAHYGLERAEVAQLPLGKSDRGEVIDFGTVRVFLAV